MDETMKLIEMAHSGDKAARERLVMDNVGLVLRQKICFKLEVSV